MFCHKARNRFLRRFTVRSFTIFLLFPCFFNSVSNIFLLEIQEVQCFHKGRNKRFFISQRQEWRVEWSIPQNLLHIVFDKFWIGNNHWTMVVIVAAKFLRAMLHTRVPNKVYLCIRKVTNMTMYRLCWVASCIRWNRINSLVVLFLCSVIGKDYFIAKCIKECKPEWEILIHIEDARNTYAHFTFKLWNIFLQIIVEVTAQFYIYQVRNCFAFLLNHTSRTTVTTIACYIGTTIGECVNCQHTVVGAKSAIAHCRSNL